MVLALLSLSQAVAAQSNTAPDSTSTSAVPASACATPSSPDLVSKRIVDQRIEPASPAPGLDEPIATIAERLAEHVRTALGGTPDSMPSVDALANAHVDGVAPATIVLHRNQPPTWRVDSGPSIDARIVVLYTTALRDLSADAPHLDWPAGLSSDSAVLSVSLSTYRIGNTTGKIVRVVHGRVLPVFLMKDQPNADEQPIVRRPARPMVPYSLIRSGIAETVVLEATVLPNGHVDPATIRDVREAASASDSSRFEYYHTKFVAAARQAILDTWFFPARSSGCAVAALVRLPYSFGFEHR
jgi:hypothetical protein